MEVESDFSFEERNQGPVVEAGIPCVMFHSQAVQVNIETGHKSCQVNMRGDQLLFKSVGTQTEAHEDVSEMSTQTETGQFSDTFPSDCYEDGEFLSSQETAYPSDSTQFVSPQKKRLKTLLSECSDSETEDQSSSVSESEMDVNVPNPQDDSKYLVFEHQLFELLTRCKECGALVIKKEKNTQGTLLRVSLTCINDHTYTWQSQPFLNRMAAGNLLVTSSILLSGATYTKVACIADILQLQFLSEKTFCVIQDEYLFPVVNEAWLREQESVFEDIGDRGVWLSGDGRCDSPGFNAKYGTYTMLDQQTDKVVDFHIVQVSEVSSSNAMEREGFRRCMDTMSAKGAHIEVVATDGHIGIAADMKKEHPNKEHQQDVWHIARRITTKLTEKAKKKDCGDLFAWVKAVSNHLWWCADTCGGNKEMIREKWLSLIHHVANIHTWDSANIYHQCSHPPIPRHEAKKKIWLKPGTPPHDALKSVVLDKNIVKAIMMLNLCCHTGSLEVYHSVQTSFVPKRQHFSFKGMVARSQLAALHHNANTHRDQARSTKGENEGELRYKIVFPKRTKEWVAKPIKENISKDYLRPILDAVVARKNASYNDRSEGVDTDHIVQNIASKPRPPKAEVIARHTSRFART